MHPHTYRVELRLRHAQADLSELGAHLEIDPSHSRCWRAGDPRVTPKGTVLPGVRRESSWATDLTPGASPRSSEDERLEDLLESQLDRLAEYAGALRALRDDGGRAEFFIGLFCDANTGLILTPSLMAKAAALGIEFGFDIYPPDPPRAVEVPA